MPALQRTRRGVRSGRAGDARSARWGRLGREWAEGLDHRSLTSRASECCWRARIPSGRSTTGSVYFILDMEAQGVEVRPLHQITGEAEFNEVFLTDVRIANDGMLGEEGQGWRVAITTLMNERVAIGEAKGSGGGKPLDHLLDVCGNIARRGRTGLRQQARCPARPRHAALCRERAFSNSHRSARAARGAKGTPDPEEARWGSSRQQS